MEENTIKYDIEVEVISFLAEEAVNMYDICLNQTFGIPPDLSDFRQEVPILTDPTFQQRLFPQATTPGVLGLELPRDLAKRLLERFLAAGSDGYCFPAAYHHPHLTLEQATVIAAQEIEQQRMRSDSTDVFFKRMILEWYPGVEGKPVVYETTNNVLEAIYFFREIPVYWEFLANSVNMRKKGFIPGAWGVSVDKLDGHVWQSEEFNHLRKGELFDL